MPALLRADTRLWTPGQIKPTGIPRIDWSHPLAAGLVFYGFDTGLGVIVDLVAGRLANAVTGATKAPLGASAWGAGFAWNNSDGRYFNSDAAIRAATAAPPWTMATACSPTSLSTNPNTFGRYANNGGTAPFVNWTCPMTATTVGASLCSGGVDTAIGTVASVSAADTFLSAAIVANSSSVAGLYVNGQQSGSNTTGLNIQSSNTNDPIGFSTASNAGVKFPFTGLIFYGAFWSRALSATELLQLHLDPYCFLVPAEGEMPARYGAGQAAFVELIGG